jgi:tetratricopeptide (TPR) repeat protein
MRARSTVSDPSPPRRLAATLLGAALVVTACAPGGPGAVSPNEIPALEQRLAQAPNDGDALLRYAAALYAAGRCDTATVVAQRGMGVKPQDALGPLVVGRCLEQDQRLDEAHVVYARYMTSYADRPGAAGIRSRQGIVRRERAIAAARDALAREAELAQVPAEPTTVAVLPVQVVGDSAYQPLSRGLAEIMTTDLALLERFRMVERLQVGALLGELNLTQAGRVDPATAVRVGHLVRAGSMVQGLATIPPRGTTRLEAAVVRSDGEVTAPARQDGAVRDLLKMEKQLVVEIARQLGYELSAAELEMVLENGTQNLAAFLAYSRGLLAEDRGDYRSAAAFYAEAAQADPNFDVARDAYEAATVSVETSLSLPSAITTLSSVEVVAPGVGTELPLGGVLTTTVTDIAATQSETTAPTSTQVTSGAQTSASQPPPTITVLGTPVAATGVVRIIFRLP